MQKTAPSRGDAVSFFFSFLRQSVFGAPFAHAVQDGNEGAASFGEAVLHLRRNLGIFFPVNELIRLKLFQGGAQGLVGNAPDIALHFIEPHHAEFHQCIQDGHFIFPVDQGKGVAESGRSQAFIGNTAFVHCTILRVSILLLFQYRTFMCVLVFISTLAIILIKPESEVNPGREIPFPTAAFRPYRGSKRRKSL